MKYSGVYWVGPMYDSGGYGNVSRNYVKALDKAGIPVRILYYGDVHQDIGEETLQFLLSKQNTDVGDNAVLIVNHGGDNVDMPISYEIMKNVKKRIGVTIFETDRLPSQWLSHCNNVDELWVCGEFNYNTFKNSGVDASKMKIVPYTLDTRLYDSNKPFAPYFKSDETEFKFLYVSTFGYRKGYDLLLKAYCNEFTNDEDVSLVLKVDVPFFSTEDKVLKILASYIPKKHPKIKLLIGKDKQDRMVDLYRSVDAYVSTDRANGWGMPCMESMALGIPTATINWSGSTSFMNESNSFPIEPEDELIPVGSELQNDPNFGSIYRGHMWADVKVETVQKVLREMYENKEKRERVAKKAKQDIHSNYSLDAIGNTIKELLSLTL